MRTINHAEFFTIIETKGEYAQVTCRLCKDSILMNTWLFRAAHLVEAHNFFPSDMENNTIMKQRVIR